jgi:hypothetical protein
MAMRAVNFIDVVGIVFFCRFFCHDAGPLAKRAKIPSEPRGSTAITARARNFVDLGTIVGGCLLLCDYDVPFAECTEIADEAGETSATAMWTVCFVKLDERSVER